MAAPASLPNGSPETIVERGVLEGARATGAWVAGILDAIGDKENPREIRAAVARLEAKLPLAEFARLVERQLIHGAMLGAVDSDWEAQRDDGEVKPAEFSIRFKGGIADTPYAEALRLFESRNLVDRDTFDRLTAAAKRRAFTVARLGRRELLGVVHAELARQMRTAGAPPKTGKGVELKQFRKFMRERFESAGWTPASRSHVETIFRTNVVSAYSSGRHAHMTQPAVLASRPYWQILTVNDGAPRQRKTHQDAHGIVLLASDPFWKTAYPPFGYNCRCRVVSRSVAWFEANGSRLGPTPKGLPDKGFSSGTKSLLVSVPVPKAATTQAIKSPPPPSLPSPPPPARTPSRAPPPTPPAADSHDAFTDAGIRLTPAEFARFQQSAEDVFGSRLEVADVELIAGKAHMPGTATVSVYSSRDSVTVEGIYRQGSSYVGEVRRRFWQSSDGPEVYHAYFKLNDTLQGKGTATAVLRDAFETYEKLGVRKVTLTAAWIGRYTWPRMGFRFAGSPSEFRSLKKDFGDWLVTRGSDKTDVDAIVDSIDSMHDLAVAKVGKDEVGREFLTALPDREMFDLAIDVDRSDPDYQRLAAYLGIGKQKMAAAGGKRRRRPANDVGGPGSRTAPADKPEHDGSNDFLLDPEFERAFPTRDYRPGK